MYENQILALLGECFQYATHHYIDILGLSMQSGRAQTY